MPDYEFTNDYNLQITPFLTKFDTVFTLNQDRLLELRYRQRMEICGKPLGAIGLRMASSGAFSPH